MQDSLLQFFGESEITFDKFSIKTPSGEVLKEGKSVHLEPQVFTFLLLLIRHKEHIVSRDEIVSEVWAGKNASDDAVRALVKKLRIALGDNARAPKFVKTVPLKGYLFIMPVEIAFHQDKWWRHKYAIYSGGALAVIALTLLIQSQFGSFQSNEKLEERKVSSSFITQLEGSEVSPYLSKDELLLFSNLPKSESHQHLFIKNINKEISRRLTWGNNDYLDGILSNDGSQALVRRVGSEKTELVLFDINESLDISNVANIELDPALLFQKISALSYSSNGQFLYLFGQQDKKALSDPTQTVNYGLIKYHIENKSSVMLPLPLAKNSNVTAAKESSDGSLLAVIIEGKNTSELQLYAVDDKTMLASKVIPNEVNSLTWSPDASSVSFATKQGVLYNFDILKQRIYEWNGVPFPIDGVVSQCGEHCFILKERGKFATDIVEKPMPFSNIDYLSTLQINLSSMNLFPNYISDSNDLYFASRLTDTLILQRYSADSGIADILKLPASDNLTSLVLSPDGNYMAGEVDERVFVADLRSLSFRFLTQLKPGTTRPHWSLDSSALYLQTSRVNEQGATEFQIDYFDTSTNKLKTVAADIALLKPLTSGFWLVVNSQTEGIIVSDQSLQPLIAENDLVNFALLLSLPEESRYSLGKLQHLEPNNFVVANQALHYINSQGDEFSLHKVDLSGPTLTTSSSTFGKKLIKPQLSVHGSGEKLLLVESTVRKSQLMKVDGLRLVPQKIKRVVSETP